MPSSPTPKKQTFVQTERAAHLAWGKLSAHKPMAACCLHQLIALMDRQNTVCIAHKTLAKMLNIHIRSVNRGVKYLEENGWIQRIQMGSTASVNAYSINSRVAWADKRDNKKFSRFHAVIIADIDDQNEVALSTEELKKVPLIYPPDEIPLPTGEWPEGETGFLEGTEPTAEGWPDPRQMDIEDY